MGIFDVSSEISSFFAYMTTTHMLYLWLSLYVFLFILIIAMLSANMPFGMIVVVLIPFLIIAALNSWQLALVLIILSGLIVFLFLKGIISLIN